MEMDNENHFVNFDAIQEKGMFEIDKIMYIFIYLSMNKSKLIM